MWITAIISYPLALILDFVIGACRDTHEVFTSDQLAILIKSQEQSENNPIGRLGKDATRVLLGALNLDGRRIDRVVADPREQSFDGDEKDVEKAEHSVVHGMIVKWYAVKTIDINDPVDQDFIDKIRSWSYSRIPVIGKSGGRATQSQIWEGTKIFGFLHIKVRICSITRRCFLHRQMPAQGSLSQYHFLHYPSQECLIRIKALMKYCTIGIPLELEEAIHLLMTILVEPGWHRRESQARK